LNIHVSQGSAATRLRCGVTYGYGFVVMLLLSQPWKKFWKSANLSKLWTESLVAHF